ncbi:MAG: ABC transporter permease [Deltaproteobacteria bacterium]|nr:ABC transporter permease [Deltaproteobacteria bacterium]
MDTLKFFGRRFIHSIFVFLTIVTILFFIFRLMPGDPTMLFISPEMSVDAIENIRRLFGLDQPLYIQYVKYIANIFLGNYGISYYFMEPAAPIVFESLKNTLILTVPAMCLSYLFGVVGGTLLAWWRGRKRELVGMAFALILRSAPAFWIGLIFLYFFAFHLELFPGGSITETGATYQNFWEMVLSWNFIHHLILPLISMSCYLTGLPLLLTRTSVLEVIKEDYVEMARAKGIGPRKVMFRHVTRTAILPVLTAFATAIAYAFGGSVLIEVVFTWPGIGRLMVDSMLGNDYPVAQFAFMIMACMMILMNLFADFFYAYLDPRVVVK